MPRPFPAASKIQPANIQRLRTKRSHIYTTSMTDLYNQDSIAGLSIHHQHHVSKYGR